MPAVMRADEPIDGNSVGVVGRADLPAAGLPAGWARWKVSPHGCKACPTVPAHTRHFVCRTTLENRESARLDGAVSQHREWGPY